MGHYKIVVVTLIVRQDGREQEGLKVGLIVVVHNRNVKLNHNPAHNHSQFGFRIQGLEVCRKQDLA